MALSARLRDGGLVCSTLTTPDSGKRMRSFPRFETAAGSAGFIESDAWRGAVTSRWSVMLSQPVHDSAGRAATVLVLTLDLLKTQKVVLRAADLSSRMVTTIIDRRGLVAMRSAEPEAWVGSPAGAVRQALIAGRQQGDAAHSSADGVRRRAAFVTLLGLG